MDNCKIIEDLLPSYCDGLTSEETNELIRSHVESCPNCAKLLEKMSAEPPREIIDHREQFRRKLKEYEQKHHAKVLRVILACSILLMLIILVWHNSYAISKWVADSKMQESVSYLVSRSETESYYVYNTPDGPILVILAKNDFLDLWYIAQIDDSSSPVWVGGNNHQWFDGTLLMGDFEFHYLYIGTDAKTLIQLDSVDIPGDVYVAVNQHGANYWIHVMSDNVDAINQLNMTELLKTKGFIE